MIAHAHLSWLLLRYSFSLLLLLLTTFSSHSLRDSNERGCKKHAHKQPKQIRLAEKYQKKNNYIDEKQEERETI